MEYCLTFLLLHRSRICLAAQFGRGRKKKTQLFPFQKHSKKRKKEGGGGKTEQGAFEGSVTRSLRAPNRPERPDESGSPPPYSAVLSFPFLPDTLAEALPGQWSGTEQAPRTGPPEAQAFGSLNIAMSRVNDLRDERGNIPLVSLDVGYSITG